MLRRVFAGVAVVWALGFAWFAAVLPQPAGAGRSDAVVVLTGASGRVERGLAVLDNHWAPRMFVSGVDRDVKPREFAATFHVSAAQMKCCVTLGFSATDTASNARETAQWAKTRKLRAIRLVTSDWHMRRAAMELRRRLPDGIAVVEDAVQSRPNLRILFVEYHKLLARFLLGLLGT